MGKFSFALSPFGYEHRTRYPSWRLIQSTSLIGLSGQQAFPDARDEGSASAGPEFRFEDESDTAVGQSGRDGLIFDRGIGGVCEGARSGALAAEWAERLTSSRSG
ncbi:hypothetical protein [Rhizobium leguminosarum]|uniref:hypothetical protein n=1 Tax=Rhizobium leguminosarum TaxID=384 RepID=UPI00143F3D00|nr:hypothetical protein [Rhizobium leguminosarum]NKL23311.1 hypothetical protein [Rhizobium leguminosarum bv. viciae]